MSTFYYVGIDAKGKVVKGSVEADNAKLARQGVRAKGLSPTEVSLAKTGSGDLFSKASSLQNYSFNKNFTLKAFFARSPIPHKELTLVTRQLATLFSAGLPISEVLTAVCEQTSAPKAKAVLLSVRAKVLEGHALASALREHPEVFSPLYCGIVASGEKSGSLAPVLEGLADYTEQQFKLKQKITYALIYPGVLIAVSMTIIIFLLEYVVPKMVAVYSHVNQALPTLTQILIASSNNIKNYGLYFLILLAVGIFTFRHTLRKNIDFRKRFHAFLLKLPLLGNSIKTVNTARYARTLSMLCSAGIPIIDGMTTASNLISNLPIRAAVQTATNHVREGAAIHLALKQTAYFSPMSIHLIASGEASGQLEALLARTASQQEDEINRVIDTLMSLFEPALILIMGGIVLFIVLAVLLPIFELNQISM